MQNTFFDQILNIDQYNIRGNYGKSLTTDDVDERINRFNVALNDCRVLLDYHSDKRDYSNLEDMSEFCRQISFDKTDALMEKNDLNDLLREYTNLLSYNQFDVEILKKISDVEEKLEMYPRALDHMSIALALDPENEDAEYMKEKIQELELLWNRQKSLL